MAGMFPGKWVRENGAAPVNNAGGLTTAGELWFQVMSGITPRQVAEGLANCLRSALQWPPNPGQFRAMCLGVPALRDGSGWSNGNRPGASARTHAPHRTHRSEILERAVMYLE